MRTDLVRQSGSAKRNGKVPVKFNQVNDKLRLFLCPSCLISSRPKKKKKKEQVANETALHLTIFYFPSTKRWSEHFIRLERLILFEILVDICFRGIFLSSIIYSFILNTVKLQVAFHRKKYSNFILICKYDWHDFSNSFFNLLSKFLSIYKTVQRENFLENDLSIGEYLKFSGIRFRTWLELVLL